jgi:hypothetical protein
MKFRRTTTRVSDQDTGPQPKPTADKLLPLRSAVVFLFALLIATAAGTLSYLGAREIVAAVGAGGVAFGGVVFFLDKIIAT